jgi:hypothetical protein
MMRASSAAPGRSGRRCRPAAPGAPDVPWRCAARARRPWRSAVTGVCSCSAPRLPPRRAPAPACTSAGAGGPSAGRARRCGSAGWRSTGSVAGDALQRVAVDLLDAVGPGAGRALARRWWPGPGSRRASRSRCWCARCARAAGPAPRSTCPHAARVVQAQLRFDDVLVAGQAVDGLAAVAAAGAPAQFARFQQHHAQAAVASSSAARQPARPAADDGHVAARGRRPAARRLPALRRGGVVRVACQFRSVASRHSMGYSVLVRRPTSGRAPAVSTIWSIWLALHDQRRRQRDDVAGGADQHALLLKQSGRRRTRAWPVRPARRPVRCRHQADVAHVDHVGLALQRVHRIRPK